MNSQSKPCLGVLVLPLAFVTLVNTGPSRQSESAQAIARHLCGGCGAARILYDTVWDVLRLIDYLETRGDIDAKRIGLIGFSKGGMETYLAAAVDPRIAAAVPCIGAQSFRWALENSAWQSRVETFQAAINGAAKDAGVAEINADFVRRFFDRVVPGIHSGDARFPSSSDRLVREVAQALIRSNCTEG